MDRTTNVLVVSGASRPDSNLRAVVELVTTTLSTLAEDDKRAVATKTLDLATTALPVMEFGDDAQAGLPEVGQVRSTARWADGFVILTPEYHGNMSGALKNWFDFLYLELAGKFAGVISVTGGGCGDMSITAVKNCFAWCHGFTLPFHAAVRAEDFDTGGVLTGARVRDRILRIAHDVVRYAAPLRDTFEAARSEGEAPSAGVAGLHSKDDLDG